MVYFKTLYILKRMVTFKSGILHRIFSYFSRLEKRFIILEIYEDKEKNQGKGLVSSSVSKNYIYNPRSRPRKIEDKDLDPRLVLVRRPLENLCLDW